MDATSTDGEPESAGECMDDTEKMRSGLHLQVLGTDEATEKLRRLWKRFCDGEVSERTWERAWDRYFRVRLAVRDANRTAGKD